MVSITSMSNMPWGWLQQIDQVGKSWPIAKAALAEARAEAAKSPAQVEIRVVDHAASILYSAA